MADPEHLEILKRGKTVWNEWRRENPDIQPDLGGADLGTMNLNGIDFRWANLGRAILRRARLREAELRWAELDQANLREARLRGANLGGVHLGGADLSGAQLRDAHLGDAQLGKADLSGADLRRACLQGAHLGAALLLGTQLGEADLRRADLRQANLRGARLRGADLRQANLREANCVWAHLLEADLQEANLQEANLSRVNLSMANLCRAHLEHTDLSGSNVCGANLAGASLIKARLVETNFANANLTGCNIYGVSTWGIQLTDAVQANLRITPDDEITVMVDSFEAAQLIQILLQYEHMHGVIEAMTTKLVLILGRFDESRSVLLEAIQDTLRHHHLMPLVCEMRSPMQADMSMMIANLAHVACFVIVDITHLTDEVVSTLIRTTGVPVLPILQQDAGHDPLTPYRDAQPNALLFDTYAYQQAADLGSAFVSRIHAAEARAKALQIEKTTLTASLTH